MIIAALFNFRPLPILVLESLNSDSYSEHVINEQVVWQQVDDVDILLAWIQTPYSRASNTTTVTATTASTTTTAT